MPSATSKLALWALIPVLASLCGCAIPPALTIASFVVNGMSYAATGKSVSDHGLSAMVGQDCALWRVLADRKVCQDNPAEPAGPVVAKAAPAPDLPQLASPADATSDLPQLASPADATSDLPQLASLTEIAADLPKVPTLPAAATITKLPTQAAERPVALEARRFLVLGSFINPDNAKHLAASLRGVETTIAAVGKDGEIFHRVIAGPLDDNGLKTLSERMVLQAGLRPWEITEPSGEAPPIAIAAVASPTRDATTLSARSPILPPQSKEVPPNPSEIALGLQ